tara:strand:- start:215 stop:937 length:723 start_codon:yes stop_codon:yes gene_type:complete
MKKKLTYLFITSLFIPTGLVFSHTLDTLNDGLDSSSKLIKINKIRLGVDLLKPIISYTNNDNLSYELAGDIQFTDDLFIAGEYGSVDQLIEDENINFNSNGNYLKLGFDYNMFENWVGMDNSIYIGLRYATSNFSNKIENYIVRNPDSYFSNLVQDDYETVSHSNLNGDWVEVVAGIKVETFKNIYFGFSLRLNKLLSTRRPENFDNLHIPGFNKLTDNNTWGSGFNYTLTYSFRLKKRK